MLRSAFRVGSRAFLLCTLALLSACFPFKKNTHFENASDIRHWQASGKLGIRSQNKAKSVNFVWRQKGKEFNISLHGTLGIGAAKLSYRKGVYTLEADGEKRRAESAESLLYDTLGWEFPVGELHHWLKGVSAPGTTPGDLSYNDNGTLAQFHQQGWDVRYLKYHDQHPPMPRKIKATHEQLALTIIIKSWQF